MTSFDGHSAFKKPILLKWLIVIARSSDSDIVLNMNCFKYLCFMLNDLSSVCVCVCVCVCVRMCACVCVHVHTCP